MKPYPVNALRFCKNCRNMRLVQVGADMIKENMHCVDGIKWITENFVDGHGHWDVGDGTRHSLPWCSSINKDGKCEGYIPKE